MNADPQNIPISSPSAGVSFNNWPINRPKKCYKGSWDAVQTHRTVKDHTVAVAHTFDVGGEVEADGPVANGVHSLGIEEVVGPRWRR